ncbi:MAG: hypothetical protein NTX09_01790, partial [Verrucomicrobia bacterium]|nr:hypothetical protein [Verrucomicrobiota bacterium]
PRPESEFLSVVTPLLSDPSPSVRAALGDALRRVPRASARVMSLAAQLGATSLPAVVAPANPWPRYEREFERYLARWAMELNPTATAALLASPEGRALPLENRILATLALGGKDAAIGIARLTPELTRPLGDEEVRALAAHFAEPAVRDALSQSLAAAATRAPVLRALLTLRTSLDTTPLNTALTSAASALLTSSDAADTTFGAQVAGAFKLAATEPALTALLTRDLAVLSTLKSQLSTPPSPALAALRALRENALGPVATFERLARSSADASVRDEALAALAASRDPQAPALLVALLPSLTVSQRGTALDRLASTTAGANAILAGLRAKTVSKTDLGVNTADKLRTLLPADPAVAALWKDLGGDAQRALRLDGANADFSATQLTLTGPFTVECWAKLDPTINNVDALLSAPGKVSINFHVAQLRVWLNGHSPADIVVAKKKTTPRVWTHYAITRDAKGVFSLFINGELDATSTTANPDTLAGLDLGRANPKNGGTGGWLAEFRVWSVARSAKEIRENFDRSLTLSEVGGHVPVPALRPSHLTHVSPTMLLRCSPPPKPPCRMKNSPASACSPTPAAIRTTGSNSSPRSASPATSSPAKAARSPPPSTAWVIPASKPSSVTSSRRAPRWRARIGLSGSSSPTAPSATASWSKNPPTPSSSAPPVPKTAAFRATRSAPPPTSAALSCRKAS